MTNVNAVVVEVRPIGGTSLGGHKIGFLDSAAKAAQNDTVTVQNAAEVIWAGISIDATGASETNTISGNVITLTSATTGAVSGMVYYR